MKIFFVFGVITLLVELQVFIMQHEVSSVNCQIKQLQGVINADSN